jgi:hypothetical protein
MIILTEAFSPSLYYRKCHLTGSVHKPLTVYTFFPWQLYDSLSRVPRSVSRELIPTSAFCLLISGVSGYENWVWRYAPVIPAPGRLRQEDCAFEASLGYIGRPCLKQQDKPPPKQCSFPRLTFVSNKESSPATPAIMKDVNSLVAFRQNRNESELGFMGQRGHLKFSVGES